MVVVVLVVVLGGGPQLTSTVSQPVPVCVGSVFAHGHEEGHSSTSSVQGPGSSQRHLHRLVAQLAVVVVLVVVLVLQGSGVVVVVVGLGVQGVLALSQSVQGSVDGAAQAQPPGTPSVQLLLT